MSPYILAIDNGTTSTRAIIFDDKTRKVATSQLETTQSFPQPGWVEQDPSELWLNTRKVIEDALAQASLSPSDISSVGITTQRETIICWDRATGAPLAPAIVWQDVRTQDWLEEKFDENTRQRITELSGLPVTAYFSASKLRWLIDNNTAVKNAYAAGTLLVGTPDCWLAWNITGGVNDGEHVTDVTNASRTQLMNIHSLEWDAELLSLFDLTEDVLPRIVPSISSIGTCAAPLEGVALGCIMGDQQAATFGQVAFHAGQAKNTYGTGTFLMLNTGTEIVRSSSGLITTVAYQRAGEPAYYALEGSVAVSGSLIQWLRDNLGIIGSASEVEQLAASVPDNGDVYFVPAFSGLFAPYWRPDARGAIVGLTRFATKAHIARAALEASAYQTFDVVSACNKEAPTPLSSLKVDGGMVANELLMQFQSDILGVPVVRPTVTETTALGAAFGAGLTAGMWPSLDALEDLWSEDSRWEPHMLATQRDALLAQWHRAVDKSLNWVD